MKKKKKRRKKPNLYIVNLKFCNTPKYSVTYQGVLTQIKKHCYTHKDCYEAGLVMNHLELTNFCLVWHNSFKLLMVTHLSSEQAHHCLTSVIKQEP